MKTQKRHMLFLTSSPINDNRCYLFLWFTSYLFLYKQLKKKKTYQGRSKDLGNIPNVGNNYHYAIQVSYQPPWHLQGSNFPRAVHLPGPPRNTPISARCRRFQSCIRSLLWDPWTVRDDRSALLQMNANGSKISTHLGPSLWFGALQNDPSFVHF